jgi:hypothetical protein
MAVRRVLLLSVVLLAVSPGLSACGASLSANSTCRDFLQATPQDQDAAVSQVASDLRAGNALTPLGRPNIDYLCANDPTMTLGAAVKSSG